MDWVSTKEFLPKGREGVLIITKFGHITNATYGGTDCGKPYFRPDGLKPDKDVKWWMPIPDDGWKDIKEEQPKDGEAVLIRGRYGDIFNGVWKRWLGSDRYGFEPFVWEVFWWREVPKLPDGVALKA